MAGKTIRRVTVLILVVAALAGTGRAFAGEAAYAAVPGDKEMAPDFTLPSVTGGMVSLSDFRGRWVLLNFWATWCAPCVDEMPGLNRLYRTLKKDGLVMLAVSLDDAPKRVRRFVAREGLSFPVLHDRKKVTKDPYCLFSVPTTVLVAPDGEIKARSAGGRQWDSPEMVRYLRRLMAENPRQKSAKAD